VISEHPAVVEALSVPARRPIEPVFVRRLVGLSRRYERAMSDIEYRFTVRPLPRMRAAAT
jgi:hypothetical protein